MKPEEIEDLSFEIIDREAGEHEFTDPQWRVVQRVIHTTADFEYMNNVRFHNNAIEQGITAIRNGCTIIADTTMALSGIRKKDLAQCHGRAICLINDPDVTKKAKALGTTRAQQAVNYAVDRFNSAVYVIGNAPTSLLRLIELTRENRVKPELVIGFPVGFVNAAESKQELLKLDIPYITNIGRKGGSNVAAAVMNALIIMAECRHKDTDL